MRTLKNVLVGVAAFAAMFPLACVGLLVRGLYEGLKLGWRMPELVAAKRAAGMVAHAIAEMERS